MEWQVVPNEEYENLFPQIKKNTLLVRNWVRQYYGNIDILDRIDNTDPAGKTPDFWPEEIKEARKKYLIRPETEVYY